MRDSLDDLRHDLQRRLHDIRSRAEALSPLDIHARMDAIRGEADRAGLHAMEGLARMSAQLALLPGCRVATRACLDHASDAIGAASPAERQAILAAVALRLN
ncbi:hypothetical protein [Sphingomonas astaxanthinifaciens]|uniref:HPt domain-containing protein n=1 Tax=Sphingomonas astaxanthinifaciens DSM 22298 TaxID=1123267 RepID=A0ABQ5Z9X9_9SPHN|nr:hypothetical protein [Sphingomonas astaxanthinifaciens]GLR47589.1 hypothetical protein GCM10007925_13010 [Sphingomonas astaxanthinifaciens DSM 22298]